MDELAPQWGASALISIDVQRDVLDGATYEIAGTSAAAERIAEIRSSYLSAGWPIVHIVRLYRPDGSNVDLCRRQSVAKGKLGMVLAGTEGAEPAAAIVPEGSELDVELLLEGGIQDLGPGEVAIYKPRWGAFHETPLEDHLRALGVSTAVFAGCNFPNCPRTSIYEASERDFRVVVAEDAISGIYERGRDELRGIGAVVLGSEEISRAARSPVSPS